MKLTKFHYQEAIHMADFLQRMVDSELVQHYTFDGMSGEEKQLLGSAMHSLYKYYTALATKQDELDEK